MQRPAPIRNIDQQLTRTKRFMILVIILTLPGLIINPGDTLILGFIVGGIFGIINCILLVKRMNSLMELMKQTDINQKRAKAFMRAGFYPRMALIVGIIALAGRVDFLSIYGVGAGLLVPTVITVVDANLALYRYYTARDAVDKI
ncbi:ATP synthase subunit I [Desulfoscipio gibsoniae]|uniref:ATP synthase subunit I n=1 Tax=Desulfoscipio gibsoniae TaxID=102134 RepID=UPI0003064BC5|nr:ATP synthase subunit I [Desulfoscipio gibsoniae]